MFPQKFKTNGKIKQKDAIGTWTGIHLQPVHTMYCVRIDRSRDYNTRALPTAPSELLIQYNRNNDYKFILIDWYAKPFCQMNECILK